MSRQRCARTIALTKVLSMRAARGIQGVEPRDDRGKAAIHVDPVVAVADRLIEGDERVTLFVQPARGEAEPRLEPAAVKLGRHSEQFRLAT